MGGVPTKMRKGNTKFESVNESFSQGEKLKTLKRTKPVVTIMTRESNLLWTNQHVKKSWEVFNIGFIPDQRLEKLQSRMLSKLGGNTAKTRVTLTKEKIMDKQSRAEKNRLEYLEMKRGNAVRLAETKSQIDSQELRKTKVNQLAEKHEKAADNRKKQLENIKITAKKGRGSIRRRKATEIHHNKTHQAYLYLQRKMNTTHENRQKIVEEVIRKQQKREEHANRVRNKV